MAPRDRLVRAPGEDTARKRAVDSGRDPQVMVLLRTAADRLGCFAKKFVGWFDGVFREEVCWLG